MSEVWLEKGKTRAFIVYTHPSRWSSQLRCTIPLNENNESMFVNVLCIMDVSTDILACFSWHSRILLMSLSIFAKCSFIQKVASFNIYRQLAFTWILILLGFFLWFLLFCISAVEAFLLIVGHHCCEHLWRIVCVTMLVFGENWDIQEARKSVFA